MKSVLISIRPKRCEKICHEIGKDENGKPIYEKRIEVRKSAPKEVPFKVYIYCTKEKPFIQKIRFSDIPISHTQISKNLYNGKVIGEFVCYCIDRVEIVTSITADYIQVNGKRTSTTTKDSCLSFDELQKYTDGKPVYGWHISDLKIYDKPKELCEFRACNFKSMNGTDVCGNYDCKYYQDSGSYMIPPSCAKNGCIITRPPQSYMFVEEVEQ